MALRVLVTRPEPDASRTAAELLARGFEPVLAPMLTTIFDAAAEPVDPALIDAIAVTSINGIRGLAHRTDLANLLRLPLYAVGDATAQAAAEHGFGAIRSAHGDAGDLADLIAEARAPCRILYATGRDRTGELESRLRRSGFDLCILETYHTEAATRLPPAVALRLAEGGIDRILVFSARTATAFIASAERSGVLTNSQAVQIHAISAKAAEPLKAAGFQSIVIAANPDVTDLLGSLEAERPSLDRPAGQTE